jgi:hypothetical protein
MIMHPEDRKKYSELSYRALSAHLDSLAAIRGDMSQVQRGRLLGLSEGIDSFYATVGNATGFVFGPEIMERTLERKENEDYLLGLLEITTGHEIFGEAAIKHLAGYSGTQDRDLNIRFAGNLLRMLRTDPQSFKEYARVMADMFREMAAIADERVFFESSANVARRII